MSVDINVELGELLSRKACAKIIKHIIKFIAYNNQQIPYPYEGFQLLVAKKKRHSKADGNKPMSFKQMKANNFYEKIEGIHDAFETTFKSIEEELLQGSAIKEIVVVLGSTIVSPKHVYRVRIPGQLTNDECDSKIRSHLFKIYRSIISSSGVHSSKISGLTNIFILVNGECSPGWFIPKFDYRIPPGASQTVISFVDGPGSCRTCSDNVVDCLHGDGNELLISKEPEASTYDHWFQAKQALSGFQDMKIDGVSVYNMLND